VHERDDAVQAKRRRWQRQSHQGNRARLRCTTLVTEFADGQYMYDADGNILKCHPAANDVLSKNTYDGLARQEFDETSKPLFV